MPSGFLSVAGKITGSDKRNNLLDVICTDFLVGHQIQQDVERGDRKLGEYLGDIARVLDVDLIACGHDGVLVSGHEYLERAIDAMPDHQKGAVLLRLIQHNSMQLLSKKAKRALYDYLRAEFDKDTK